MITTTIPVYCPVGEAPEVTLSLVTYRSYRNQRVIAPQVDPDRWASIYPDWQEFEEMYQNEIANKG
jgi:hypothetical protein